MIASRIGEEKYNVIPWRIFRMINSSGSCPVDTLYTSLISAKDTISVSLHVARVATG